MTGEVEPFLILHKVRGEPAFDVAHQIEVDDEIWWIVTTSGHRAYPSDWFPLHSARDGCGDCIMEQLAKPTDDLPDHYTVNREKVVGYGGLLERLGLGKRKTETPLVRRKL